jgi:hypothetical protein
MGSGLHVAFRHPVSPVEREPHSSRPRLESSSQAERLADLNPAVRKHFVNTFVRVDHAPQAGVSSRHHDRILRALYADPEGHFAADLLGVSRVDGSGDRFRPVLGEEIHSYAAVVSSPLAAYGLLDHHHSGVAIAITKERVVEHSLLPVVGARDRDQQAGSKQRGFQSSPHSCGHVKPPSPSSIPQFPGLWIGPCDPYKVTYGA